MKRRERWIPVTLGLGALVLGTGMWFGWPVIRHAFDPGRQFKSYSIPSESMRPTLEPGDRLYPRALDPAGVKRGDVIVFRLGNEVRVGRVAALAGDRIEMAAGIVSLNGVRVAQSPRGQEMGQQGQPVRRLAEQFPGEAQPHLILDMSLTPQDKLPVTSIPAGHVFVLGDNRDNSSDSRLPRDSFGAGLVPVADVVGQVDFIAWSTRLPGRFDRPITKLDQ